MLELRADRLVVIIECDGRGNAKYPLTADELPTIHCDRERLIDGTWPGLWDADVELVVQCLNGESEVGDVVILCLAERNCTCCNDLATRCLDAGKCAL